MCSLIQLRNLFITLCKRDYCYYCAGTCASFPTDPHQRHISEYHQRNSQIRGPTTLSSMDPWAKWCRHQQPRSAAPFYSLQPSMQYGWPHKWRFICILTAELPWRNLGCWKLISPLTSPSVAKIKSDSAKWRFMSAIRCNEDSPSEPPKAALIRSFTPTLDDHNGGWLSIARQELSAQKRESLHLILFRGRA